MPSAKNLGDGSDVTLDETAFGAKFNGPLVHESVRAELAAQRQGTSSTKTRGEVRGGGAKPWRQKGTGRARAGSSRSPVWTGGGTVFGPRPRHYTFKVNRKERRAAFRSALSIHAERGSIAVFDPKAFDDVSTKAAAKLITDWGAKGSLIIILGDAEERAALSFRNLASVRAVVPTTNVGVADLIGAANVLVSQSALDELTARAKGEKKEEASA
jgi:large subunit ribosomal protein L4